MGSVLIIGLWVCAAVLCQLNYEDQHITLGAGQFIEFILTRETNETENEDNVNCRNINLNEDMIVEVVIAICAIAN